MVNTLLWYMGNMYSVPTAVIRWFSQTVMADVPNNHDLVHCSDCSTLAALLCGQNMVFLKRFIPPKCGQEHLCCIPVASIFKCFCSGFLQVQNFKAFVLLINSIFNKGLLTMCVQVSLVHCCCTHASTYFLVCIQIAQEPVFSLQCVHCYYVHCVLQNKFSFFVD